MPGEGLVEMTLVCKHCGTEQMILVVAGKGFAQMNERFITCVECRKDFPAMVPDRIVGGPLRA